MRWVVWEPSSADTMRRLIDSLGPAMASCQHPAPACARPAMQVIREICMENAMDIAACVADLGAMAQGVGELQVGRACGLP